MQLIGFTQKRVWLTPKRAASRWISAAGIGPSSSCSPDLLEGDLLVEVPLDVDAGEIGARAGRRASTGCGGAR